MTFDELAVGVRFIDPKGDIYRVVERHDRVAFVVWENHWPEPQWFADWTIAYWASEPEHLADKRKL